MCDKETGIAALNGRHLLALRPFSTCVRCRHPRCEDRWPGCRPMDTSEGVALGEFADAEGGVAFLSDLDRRRHVYVIGKTGTGKSTLLETMMQSDIDRYRGFGLLDPHGDLAERVADGIGSRFNDLIYIEAADPLYHVGLNPLANVPLHKRALVTAQMVEVFVVIWELSLEKQPLLIWILHNSIRLLLDTAGTTLLGVERLLVDSDYRRRLLGNATDPAVRNYWQQEFAQLSERDARETVASTRNKIGMLLSGPLRNILGQPKPTIDVRRAMDNGHIVLVNLSKGRLGAGPVRLLGATFASAFAQAAETRSTMPESERRDFTLYADEFEHFATDSFVSVLSEARKLRLNLVLSHQFMAQIPPLLREAVIGNVGSTIAFRVGSADEERLQSDLKNSELVYDQSRLAYVNVAEPLPLTATPNFSAYMRLLQDGVPTKTRLVNVYPPSLAVTGRLDAVRRHQRARHLRSQQFVEEKINRFLAPAPKPSKTRNKSGRARMTITWPVS